MISALHEFLSGEGGVAEVPAVRGRMWDVGYWKRRGGSSLATWKRYSVDY